MILVSVASILKGKVSLHETVSVRGWVRSKRDSKAGISFIAIHDGSCFDAIQAVVPQELEIPDFSRIAIWQQVYCVVVPSSLADSNKR